METSMHDNINTMRSPRAIVRYGYRENDIWREALGEHTQLLARCAYGPIDAAENHPAGSTRATAYGSRGTTWSRAA